jgi:hypothetical protein
MDNHHTEEIESAPAFERLVTVSAYTIPYEADIARSLLESEEITVFLMDYRTIYMYWLYSSALGGIKLQVRRDDLTLATEIIEAALQTGQEQTLDYSEGLCPVCRGIKTTPVVLGRRWAVLTWMLLGIPLVWPWVRLRCSSCGHTWRD